METVVASSAIELIWRKVKDALSSMVVDNAFHSVQNIADFGTIFKYLKKNMKSLSARAADIEEEINNQELSSRKKRKREVKEWLEDVKAIEKEVVELGGQVESEGFVTRLTDGGKAEQLDKQVEKLVEQSRNFGELVLDVRGTSGDAFLTKGLVGQAFNKNLETVLRLLESKEVSSIGLYGMGGVGKTTLANHINNQLMQQSGGSVFWVTVSQEFTVRSLQDKIARLLDVKLSDEDEVGKRAMRLHRALSKKKNSVLILDDVWENIDMENVGCLFSVNGCKLIITTRSLEVCRGIGCQKEIPVEILHAGEAWKLFKETLGIRTELDLEVEGIAKSMVKLCGGLPLGIITVAGSMRGKRGTHRWRNAFLQLQERVKGKDGMSEDKVFEVLRFSFDRLKQRSDKSNEFNVKQLCFLYCSLYEEDCRIGRDFLVGKFISEGLASERRSRRARVDEGHSILDELVGLCLLETCINIDGKGVKMHDLVRGMALKICEGKYMVRAGDQSFKEILHEEEWTKDLEKVSMKCSNLVCIREGFTPDCPKLSTLLLWGNTKLEVIPESFFCKMQGLCTLDLSGNSVITMLPDSISDMTRLRALLLEHCCRLEKVPYLGKLKALRELDLSGTAIKEVPAGVDELLNLRFMSMNGTGLKMLPRRLLLKLVHLEHLNIPLHIQVEIEEINNIKRLEEFSGGVKSVSDFNKFVRSRAHDSCYRIGVSIMVVLLISENRWPRAPNNNELELHKCDLKDEKVLGKDIAYLTISFCEGLSKWLVDDLSKRFDNPTSLKKLDIIRCRGIEWIMRRSDGQGLSSTLEHIKLWGLNDLKGVVMVMERERGGLGIGGFASAAVFSPLRSLVISECKKMKKVGLPVSSLPNLESILIWDCKEVEEIFQEDEGSAAASTLPNLRYLELTELPRLKRVSKATIISNSIQKISIKRCPRLINKLPLNFDDPPPSLDYIWVDREWWESLEWDNPLLPQLLHPFLNLIY